MEYEAVNGGGGSDGGVCSWLGGRGGVEWRRGGAWWVNCTIIFQRWAVPATDDLPFSLVG
jgi:hypothetical protein